MLDIELVSPKYKVVKLNTKSKARYAKGVKVGDILTFSTTILPVRYGKLYSLDVDMFVNGEYLTTLSQGEVSKISNSNAQLISIFDLELV